jgi:hypothetical protein
MYCLVERFSKSENGSSFGLYEYMDMILCQSQLVDERPLHMNNVG